MPPQNRTRLATGLVALAAIALVAGLLLMQRPAAAPAADATLLEPPTATVTRGAAAVAPEPPAEPATASPLPAQQPAQAASPLAPPVAAGPGITGSAAATVTAPVTANLVVTAAELAGAALPAGLARTGGPPVYTYRVVAEYPHDPEAFTQGLQYVDGDLYEGTGLNGASSLRRVDLETGAVEQEIHLADEHFGEGIVVVDDRIYQLTWKSNVGFIYDRASFEQVGEFAYPMEGWGLTYDGTHLIMSDGTPTITFRDPTTFAEVRRIDVVDRGIYIAPLNELEYVDGEILAHVWLTDWVVRIDPMTGKVLGWIDLSGLLAAEDRTERVDVLNGAAYDGENDRLFVTGKWWPKLFEIDLVAVE